MKRAKEIIEDVFGASYGKVSGNIYPCDKEQVIAAMREYAGQAIEECADKAVENQDMWDIGECVRNVKNLLE